VLLRVSEPCRRRVYAELVELRRAARAVLAHDGITAEDEQFHAERNATVVAHAEEYYRTMFGDRTGSWNLRDRHMAHTPDQLVVHLDWLHGDARIVVWADNSHVGDARTTQMAARGELSLGHLARERHGRDAVLVGFTTYAGTVTAAADRGARAERMRVRRAPHGSYKAILHAAGTPAFLLCPVAVSRSRRAPRAPRLERAIGVT
jgi:erythromycin esterase-like protein